MNWKKLTNENQPEEGIEVMGYNLEWVHEDFNPGGTCVCFRYEANEWSIAMWCGKCSEWHTFNTMDCHDNIKAPTHFAEITAPVMTVDEGGGLKEESNEN